MSDGALVEDHARPFAEATLAELLARVATVEHERDELRQQRDEYEKLCLLPREKDERLKRGLPGQKAERLPRNDAQLALAMLGLMLENGDDPQPRHRMRSSSRPPLARAKSRSEGRSAF